MCAFSQYHLMDYNYVDFMKVEKISELTTNRLSIYLRCLDELSNEGEKTISSRKLASRFHLNSAQIRKDLACFGEFGIRGVGYYIEELRKNLSSILGLDTEHKVGIVGAGRLGIALANYYGLTQTNFEVAALFDRDVSKIGNKIGDIEVFNISSFQEISKRDKIDVVVISVPAFCAQDVLNQVTSAGIKAVMNFAPTPLRVSKGVKLKTIDLTISLESLSYFLAQPNGSINNV